MPALKPLITKVVEKSMSSGEGSSGKGASLAHGLSPLRKEGGTQGDSKGRITTDTRADGDRSAANMDNGSGEIIRISKTTVRVDADTMSDGVTTDAGYDGRRRVGGGGGLPGLVGGGNLQEIPSTPFVKGRVWAVFGTWLSQAGVGRCFVIFKMYVLPWITSLNLSSAFR